MFTVKAYANGKTKIYEAVSFTILRDADIAEITMHVASGMDERIDVGSGERPPDWPPFFDKVIIENANGKTTEVIVAVPRSTR